MSDNCEHEHDHHHKEVKLKINKSFLFSTRAINNTLPVNIGVMSTFNPVDKPDVRNGRTEYCIIFQKSEVAKEGQSLTWRYASKELRDLDYWDVRNLIARDV